MLSRDPKPLYEPMREFVNPTLCWYHALQIGCLPDEDCVYIMWNKANSKFYWLYSITRDITVICDSDNRSAV